MADESGKRPASFTKHFHRSVPDWIEQDSRQLLEERASGAAGSRERLSEADLEALGVVDFVIVGGGAAGIAAARAARKRGASFLLVEGRQRLGGRVTCVKEGMPIEVDAGAAWVHSFSARNPLAVATAAICERWGRDHGRSRIVRPDGTRVTSRQLRRAYDAVGRMMRAAEDVGRARVERGEADISLAAAMEEAKCTAADAAAELDGEDGVDEALIGYCLHRRLQVEGSRADKLSASKWDDGGALPGGDRSAEPSMAWLLQQLAAAVPAQLGAVVTGVETREDGVVVVTAADGRAFCGRRAVITVPLGCLKADDIRFQPPLCKEKRAALAAMDVALMNKVVLAFDSDAEEGTPFWHGFGSLGWVSPHTVGEWAWWWSDDVMADAGVIIAFTTGAWSEEQEAASDEDTVAAALAVLRSMFGEERVAEPTGWHVTRWKSDPFAKGSWAVLAAGASVGSVAALAAPQGQLLFAGEACSVDGLGCAHGAYMTGYHAVMTCEL